MVALLDAAEIQADMVRNVASAGFGKWLLVSLSTLILSLVFLRRDWLVLLAGLYLIHRSDGNLRSTTQSSLRGVVIRPELRWSDNCGYS